MTVAVGMGAAQRDVSSESHRHRIHVHRASWYCADLIAATGRPSPSEPQPRARRQLARPPVRQCEELLLGAPRDERADQLPVGRHQRRAGLRAQRSRQRGLRGGDCPRSCGRWGHDQRSHMLREPEWLEAAAQLGPASSPLTIASRTSPASRRSVSPAPLAQELQSYDRHRLAQGERSKSDRGQRP